MFKKPKRNFRARKAQDEGSDGEGGGNKEEKMEIAGETYIVQETAAEDDPVTVKKKKKKTDKDKEKPVHRSGSVLSFHDEGKSLSSDGVHVNRICNLLWSSMWKRQKKKSRAFSCAYYDIPDKDMALQGS